METVTIAFNTRKNPHPIGDTTIPFFLNSRYAVLFSIDRKFFFLGQYIKEIIGICIEFIEVSWQTLLVLSNILSRISGGIWKVESRVFRGIPQGQTNIIEHFTYPVVYTQTRDNYFDRFSIGPCRLSTLLNG